MRYRRTCQVVILFFALVVAGKAFAVDTQQQVPVDNQDNWTVGFCMFTTNGLPAEFDYLGASVPQLLLADLHVVPTHTYSDEELTAYKEYILRAARKKARANLNTLVKSRDQIIFSAADEGARRQQYAAADVQIDAARARISYVDGLKPDAVTVKQEKPIVFSLDATTGRLLPAPGELSRNLADKDNLDAVVYGAISYQAGMAYLDVYVYDRALDRVVYHKDYSETPERLYNWLPLAASELAGYLLGRDWGNISVTVEPASAAIRIDGNLVGFGSATARYLTIGSHEVTVSESGYQGLSRAVDVEPSEQRDLSLKLTERSHGSSSINSIPPGADVYIGSIWTGRTPLTVPLPDEPEEVRLSLKGYLASHFLLSPAGPDKITRLLVSDSIDPSKLIRERRDQFYTHLGWFLLSVPVPIILNGLFSNVATVEQSASFWNLTSATQQRVIVSGNVFYWAAWGTAVVSAGLFVNAMISLIQYIQAGQSFHTR